MSPQLLFESGGQTVPEGRSNATDRKKLGLTTYKSIIVLTAGLRVLSLISGLICLGLIARLWGRPEMIISGFRIGRIASWIAIAFSGLLSIWLAKIAGPWLAGRQE
jgi:hypothetical protein